MRQQRQQRSWYCDTRHVYAIRSVRVSSTRRKYGAHPSTSHKSPKTPDVRPYYVSSWSLPSPRSGRAYGILVFTTRSVSLMSRNVVLRDMNISLLDENGPATYLTRTTPCIGSLQAQNELCESVTTNVAHLNPPYFGGTTSAS